MPLAYYNDPTINELVSELFGGDVPANVVMHSSNWDAVRRTATSGRAVMISDSFTEYLQPANDTMTTLKIRGTARYLFGCATSRANPPTGAQASYIDTLGDMLRAECRGYLERYGTD